MSRPLQERALGRWRGILAALGVSSHILSGKHGPCPFCGGKDRFRLIDKKGDGFWLCSQCGHGDGLEFVKRLLGLDYKGAARRIEEVIGTAPLKVARPYHDEAKRKEELRALWCPATPLTRDCLAGKYLLSRGLEPPTCGTALRWSHERRAMLAKVTDAAGKGATLQQTFLAENGEKINRKTFWGKHPIGSAVRLAPVSETLGIAEGVETALSAAKLFSIPTWAALDAYHLERWQPPKETKRVVIFADNDDSYTGQHAATGLAKRLRTLRVEVVGGVRVPSIVGMDWNDVLRSRQ